MFRVLGIYNFAADAKRCFVQKIFLDKTSDCTLGYLNIWLNYFKAIHAVIFQKMQFLFSDKKNGSRICYEKINKSVVMYAALKLFSKVKPIRIAHPNLLENC